MWVIGENKDGNNPTIQQCEDFANEKGVTFPVLRDAHFLQTYGKIDAHSTALPHQYILDAQTMELVFADGGIANKNQATLDVLSDLLGETVQ